MILNSPEKVKKHMGRRVNAVVVHVMARRFSKLFPNGRSDKVPNC